MCHWVSAFLCAARGRRSNDSSERQRPRSSTRNGRRKHERRSTRTRLRPHVYEGKRQDPVDAHPQSHRPTCLTMTTNLQRSTRAPNPQCHRTQSDAASRRDLILIRHRFLHNPRRICLVPYLLDPVGRLPGHSTAVRLRSAFRSLGLTPSPYLDNTLLPPPSPSTARPCSTNNLRWDHKNSSPYPSREELLPSSQKGALSDRTMVGLLNLYHAPSARNLVHFRACHLPSRPCHTICLCNPSWSPSLSHQEVTRAACRR